MFTKIKPRVLGLGLDRIGVSIPASSQMPPTTWQQRIHGSPHQIKGASVEVSTTRDRKAAFKRASDIVIYRTRNQTSAKQPIYGAVAGAKACAALGSEGILSALAEAIRSLIPNSTGGEATYLELYIDLQGTQRPDSSLFSRIQCRARRKVFNRRADAYTPEGRPFQGLRWGNQGRCSDNIVVCYYEKPRLPPDDWRIAKWKQSGQYREGETVCRLEFRVWGSAPLLLAGIDPALSELARGGLNNLWNFLTESCFRVLASAKSQQRKRVPSHRWWREIHERQPLAQRPLMALIHRGKSDRQLEANLLQAAGNLRSFAGLTDSDDDRALAFEAAANAADWLLAQAANRTP